MIILKVLFSKNNKVLTFFTFLDYFKYIYSLLQVKKSDSTGIRLSYPIMVRQSFTSTSLLMNGKFDKIIKSMQSKINDSEAKKQRSCPLADIK